MVGDFGGVAVRTGTRWRRSRGNGNTVANHERVVADEDLLDEEPHDPLPLHDVERLGRRPQARQKRRERSARRRCAARSRVCSTSAFSSCRSVCSR